MKLNCFKAAFASLILSISCLINVANAGLISYDILNLSNENQPTTMTYSGDGYVGMYPTKFNGIFGIEQSGYSRTALNVDVSALLDANILSAFLEYTIPQASTQQVHLTAFTANGTLGHFWDSPDNLFSQSFTSNGGVNSLDVTALLNAGLASNTGWFGLHMQGTNAYQWLGANRVSNPDAAQVNLVVNYTTSVPEPSTLAIFALGMIGLASRRFKK